MNLKETDRKLFFAITVLLILVVGGFLSILIAGANRQVGEAVNITYSYSFYSRYDENLENLIEKVPSITKPFNVGDYVADQQYTLYDYSGAKMVIKVESVGEDEVIFDYSGRICNTSELTTKLVTVKVGESYDFEGCDGYEKPHIWTVSVNE